MIFGPSCITIFDATYPYVRNETSLNRKEDNKCRKSVFMLIRIRV